MTWLQLGFHSKPCALLNTGGFYQKLYEFLHHAERQGFVKKAHRENLLMIDSINDLFVSIQKWKGSGISKL